MGATVKLKKENVTKFVYAAKCRGTYFISPLKPDTKDTLSNTSLIHTLRSTGKPWEHIGIRGING